MATPQSYRFRLATAGLLSVLFAPTSWADGDDFFQPSDRPLASQLVFVGVVRDQAGGFIYGALVTWSATSVDEAGEQISSAGTFTNRLGRYRTVDVARVVAINTLKLDPGRVELAVTKPGYTMVRRLKRTRGRQLMGLQEVDFMMAKMPTSSRQAAP